MGLSRKAKVLLNVFGVLVTLAALYLINRNFDIRSVAAGIGEFDPAIFGGVVLIYLSTFTFRTIRWLLMLPKANTVTFKSTLYAIIIGFGGNNLLPGRLGELLRMEHIKAQTGLNRITVLGSIGMEKVLDALILFGILMFCLNGLESASGTLVNLSFWLMLALALITAGIVLFRIYHQKVLNYFEASGSTKKYARLLASLIARLAEALVFLRFDKKTLFVLITSLIIWLIEGIVFVLVMKQVSGDMPILTGFLTLAIVNFSILIPSSPGYIGVFQAATVFSYSLFQLPKEEGLEAGIIIHAAQFLPTTLIALIIGGKFLLKKRK